MTKNIPTVFVIFGATGDLMTKKIVPALFNLYLKDKLPQMIRIIGYSRRLININQFKENVLEILEKNHGIKGKEKKKEEFLNHFSYKKGEFENISDYKVLAEELGRIDNEWKVCSNKLFYLAVPPQYYKVIFNNLSSSGLTIPCGPDEGWTRVLVEKPFGKDLKTAEEIDLLLAKLFKEEQIYRIDHYLAKEMLQNILNFRFSNNLFESSWNNKYIEKIDIKLLEKIGVEERGLFYDGVGALRDVGQNHLLQMLALITMDDPLDINSDLVRQKRKDILEKLTIPTEKEIKNNTFRAQYEGYQNINGVSQNSQTETYFKIRTSLNDSRFCGIPISLESGKRMKAPLKQITITFKPKTPCLFDSCSTLKNKVVISLEPNEEINIHFWAKKPGLETGLEERTLNFLYRRKIKQNSQYVEEYEKLLLDCIAGNQLLFLSTQEINAMWKFIDPISKAWSKNLIPLNKYKPDTNEILLQSSYVGGNNKTNNNFNKKIGIIGLGKMGTGISRQLIEKGWSVVGYNRTEEVTLRLEKEGLIAAKTIKELIEKLPKPRVIWIMLTAGKAVDEILFGKEGVDNYLDKGDIIIDAGNSFYKDAIRREKILSKRGIKFVDVGVSGGPGGARYGACIMVGGNRDLYEYLLPLFCEISVNEGTQFFKGVGAGHFVKMIHNGIEYGMMQAIAEGFDILKHSKYTLDLRRITSIYNHGSVIESRLIGWLEEAFELYGENLLKISGSVGYTGEGEWTVKTADEMKIKAKVIKDALKFRIQSEKNPSFSGKVLSALRNQFGGHKVS